MIQRIQTLWLFLAAVAMFLFCRIEIFGAKTASDFNLFMFVMAGLLVLVPLITIPIYKNRKNQKQIVWLALLVNILLIVLLYLEIDKWKAEAIAVNAHPSYKYGAVLPFVYIVLLILAYVAINKDEKLVKSSRRLRK